MGKVRSGPVCVWGWDLETILWWIFRPWQIMTPMEHDRVAYQAYTTRLQAALTTLNNIQHVSHGRDHSKRRCLARSHSLHAATLHQAIPLRLQHTN